MNTLTLRQVNERIAALHPYVDDDTNITEIKCDGGRILIITTDAEKFLEARDDLETALADARSIVATLDALTSK